MMGECNGEWRVKPLDWDDYGERRSKARAFLDASYMLSAWSDGKVHVSISYPGYETGINGMETYPNMDAAKAAAQADYEARILSALEPAPVRGWQPIETAPKDGTPIICFHPAEGFSDDTSIDVLWWDMGAWLYNAEPVADQPTHWMPLPTPPQGEGV